MKKRVIAFLAVFMMMLTMLPGNLMVANAAEELILKLHYHRADGNYEGWDVWLWEAGKEGKGFAFAEENGEMVATKVLTPGVTSVGFIVRTASWERTLPKTSLLTLLRWFRVRYIFM